MASDGDGSVKVMYSMNRKYLPSARGKRLSPHFRSKCVCMCVFERVHSCACVMCVVIAFLHASWRSMNFFVKVMKSSKYSEGTCHINEGSKSRTSKVD